MIIDGKKIRNEILNSLKKEIKVFNKKLKLTIFVVGDNSVINSFITYKKKTAQFLDIEFIEYKFSGKEENLENLIISEIEKQSKNTNGIVVQLPLPKHLNEDKVLQSIPTRLDIDLLNNRPLSKPLSPPLPDLGYNGCFSENPIQIGYSEKQPFHSKSETVEFEGFGKRFNKIHAPGLCKNILAPVTGAVWEILVRYKIDVKEKNILIVGRGKLVGQPSYEFFKDKCAEINIIASQTKNKEQFYKEADIIISGVGIPNLIQPEMIKAGVVLIDAGTSTAQKKLVGDIDLKCAKKASLFSRTPNGIGPITIAILYRNLVELYKKNYPQKH